MNEYIEILKVFLLCLLGVGFVHVPLPFMVYVVIIDVNVRQLLEMNEQVRVFCIGVISATMCILKAFFLIVVVYTVYYSMLLFDQFVR